MAKTKSLLSLFPLKLFFIKAFQMHFNFKLKVYLENAIKLIFFGMFFLYTLPSYPWTLSSFFVSKYHVIRYEKNDDVVSLLYKTFKAHTQWKVSIKCQVTYQGPDDAHQKPTKFFFHVRNLIFTFQIESLYTSIQV